MENKIKQNGVIWVSWPKKTAIIATDVTEDIVREVALPGASSTSKPVRSTMFGRV
jgi:hypothetical protein